MLNTILIWYNASFLIVFIFMIGVSSWDFWKNWYGRDFSWAFCLSLPAIVGSVVMTVLTAFFLFQLLVT